MKTIDELWKKLEKVELVQVHPVEIEAVYKRIFEFKNPTIVEIGSAHGASSIILAEAAKELAGVLICIDSYPENYYNQEKFGDYARQAFINNIQPYINECVVFLDMPSNEAISYGKQNYLDFACYGFDILFVDGGHEYEEVKADILNYTPLLHSGGYVAFDDYNNVAYSGVKKAVDELIGDWPTVDNVWNFIIKKKP